jgi:hypothetical protein
VILRAVTQHSFIQNRQKRLIWSAVKRELTDEKMFVSWTFLIPQNCTRRCGLRENMVLGEVDQMALFRQHRPEAGR